MVVPIPETVLTALSQAAGAGVRGLLFKPTAVEDFCRAIEALLNAPNP